MFALLSWEPLCTWGSQSGFPFEAILPVGDGGGGTPNKHGALKVVFQYCFQVS